MPKSQVFPPGFFLKVLVVRPLGVVRRLSWPQAHKCFIISFLKLIKKKSPFDFFFLH